MWTIRKFSSIPFFFYDWGLSSVTKNYFENLVRALENGLPDVNSHGAYGRAASSKNKGSTSRASSSDSGGQWACERCTLVNPKSVTICQICEHGRWIKGCQQEIFILALKDCIINVFVPRLWSSGSVFETFLHVFLLLEYQSWISLYKIIINWLNANLCKLVL